LLYKVRDLGEDEARARLADLAASYQHAIVDALATRVRQAIERERVERFANGPLRERITADCEALGVAVWIPPFDLCTDNAAMIGGAARFLDPLPYPQYLALDAAARLA
jgi:N6-L-threonylcarbamoyladenine synthase